MKKLFIITGMMLSSTSMTFADENPGYIGLGYHMGKYEESGLSDAEPSALKIEVGKYLNSNVAIEGQFLFGLGDDTVDVDGLDVDLELKNAISIFVKGDIDLGEKANLYGLIGFTKGKLEATIDEYDVSVSEDDSGLSYGFGIEGEVADGVSLNGEYIIYLSEDDYDYSGFNFGISKRF
ncbi:porin family protein [Thalassolituus sp. LLYu03]|uniref:porin family protein n=1 Tax=Thalassolituus sp. LLYu03 TaxID=3421656 RepID=UPI003D2C15FB